MRTPLIYKDVPQFGLDIGSHTAKLVQLVKHGSKVHVQGYGYCYFPKDAIVEGIIVDPEQMASAIKPLLKKLGFGKLTSKRAITGLPAAKVFTRTLQLPLMDQADLDQAVHYEVEQYVPVPVTDLYIDYEIVNRTAGKDGKDAHLDVLMMAAPRAIVDSYIKLFDALGLEISAIEASMTAVVRALLHSGDMGKNTLVMDIGSLSSDMTVYDEFTPLTGSVATGGEHYTQALVKNLKIKPDEATEIKVKFGIGPSGMREKVFPVLEPLLSNVAKEARRVIKFYEQRGEKAHKVERMVISGGSAAMPGLPEFFQAELRLPQTAANPWNKLEVKDKNLNEREAPMYATAIGLALRGLK